MCQGISNLLYMSRYDNYTREELIHRIEELETRCEGDNPNDYASQFVSKILKTLPDMLTVIDRNGTIVELISDEQTNHVGLPLSQVVGHSVREVVSEEASEAILNNMKIVFETQKGSTSHHDITIDGVTRNYENRIFPLNEDHVICMCRDITEAAAAQRRYAML